MAGFNLNMLGAGLGQFAQQYQQQQDALVRQKMLEMTLAKYQMELQDRQVEQNAASGLMGLFGGGGGQAPVRPLPGTMTPGQSSGASALLGPIPGQQPSPPAPPRPNFGAAGEYGVGQFQPQTGLPNNPVRWVQSGPSMAPGEGGNFAVGPEESRLLAGAKEPNVANMPPPSTRGPPPAAAPAGGGDMTPQQAGSFASSLADSLGGGDDQAAATGLRAAITSDPSRNGMQTIEELAARINQAMPNASPREKVRAMEMGQKFLAPEQRMQFQQQMREMQFQQQSQLKDMGFQQQQQLADQRAQAALDRQAGQFALKEQLAKDSYGWEVRTDKDGTDYRYNRRTGEAKGLIGDDPYTPTGAAKTGTAGGAARKSEQIDVTDPETGKSIFSGLAHEAAPNKWVSASDGTPIDTTGKKMVRTPLSMGITSQNIGNRISMGANEVARAVENMTSLPIGTTLGWFGGAQSMAPKELGQGLRRNLANAVTPESAQMLAAMARGVERGLGILAAAGAATGLVTLQESLRAEIPQANDTGYTVLTKYANMRQLVEAANDTIQASSMVAEPQKKQMQVNTDRITKAVPWTVADIIRLQTDPSDESVAAFAKNLGLGKKVAGETSGGAAGGAVSPPPEALTRLKQNDTPDERRMFDEVFGAGAAAKALGK
jgi:hypothetical protein